MQAVYATLSVVVSKNQGSPSYTLLSDRQTQMMVESNDDHAEDRSSSEERSVYDVEEHQGGGLERSRRCSGGDGARIERKSAGQGMSQTDREKARERERVWEWRTKHSVSASAPEAGAVGLRKEGQSIE